MLATARNAAANWKEEEYSQGKWEAGGFLPPLFIWKMKQKQCGTIQIFWLQNKKELKTEFSSRIIFIFWDYKQKPRKKDISLWVEGNQTTAATSFIQFF